MGSLEHSIGTSPSLGHAPQREPARTPSSQAFWFGDRERPLFGWYHAACGRVRAAVVLCSAFGHEEMSTHRGYFHLAQRLAAEGFAVLRFDYDGTGNSAGEPTDDERVAAWLASIDSARAKVSELSRASKVVLFGARFGALLALTHAGRKPVDGLILFAPPPSGKAWVREMRALALLREALLQAPPTPEAGIVGFPLPEAARRDLAALDWKASGVRPAAEALIIARDDLRGKESELVSELGVRGTRATYCSEPGYKDFLQDDPVRAKVPARVFDAIARWLDESFPPSSASLTGLSGPPSSRSNPSTHVALGQRIREEVLQLSGLFGVLTEPVSPNARSRAALVLLNIGANHHAGSNRMYVTLARRLAALGFCCVRVDFSGIGDSSVSPGGRENDVYSRRSFEEARSVVDFLIARGATQVVLGGLCSGAYTAYHAATADSRVAGVVMVNPLTFHWNDGDSLEVRTRQSFKASSFYRRALLRPETWLRLVRGKVDSPALARELLKRSDRRARREVRALWARLSGGMAETSDIERGFRALCSRGAPCLLLFSSNDAGIDLIEEHLGPAASKMSSTPNFVMQVLRGPDHTFTPLWTQHSFFELVTAYMLKHFGAGTT
jgi:pimeloyl-ACP methyl ester carboxylesterase